MIGESIMNVSAVVPVHNASAFIQLTLESLLRQDGILDEIIVIDDASDDGTYQLVSRLAENDRRIKTHRFSRNQGVSAARNFGINAAQGEWVLFFDGDDIAHEKLLIKQLDRIKKNESDGYGKVILIHSAYQQINEAGEEISSIMRWRQVREDELFGYMLLRNPIITASGVLARKSSLEQAGCFNPEIYYSEDWDLWLRLARCGIFCYIDEPLVYVRRYRNNTSKSVDTMLEGERKVLRQYSTDEIKAAIFRRDLSWQENATDYAALLFRLNEWDNGRNLLQKVVSRDPSFVSGRFQLGIYYLKTQQWANAVDSFNDILAMDKRNGAALNNLGALFAANGKFEEAFDYLNKAMAYFPRYMDAKKNIELLISSPNICPDYADLYFTWRELRPVVLSYQE